MIVSCTRWCVAVVLAVGLWAGVAAGMFRRPEYLPVERLIENAAAYVREHPDDAGGYYTLARVSGTGYAGR
jgi:hypothetical protein